jgi:hypothetical protein
MLISCLAYSLTVKMEATCSSETSVDFQRTTSRYIPDYKVLHNHRCENLKAYTGSYYDSKHSVLWTISCTYFRKMPFPILPRSCNQTLWVLVFQSTKRNYISREREDEKSLLLWFGLLLLQWLQNQISSLLASPAHPDWNSPVPLLKKVRIAPVFDADS